MDTPPHSVCSPVQAAEVFPVAGPELEQGDGLTVGGLPAFQFQGVKGGKVEWMGLVVGGDLIFGRAGVLPPARARAQAGTWCCSGDRRPNGGSGHCGLGHFKHTVFAPSA